MYAFITSGTKAFLNKLVEAHPNKNLLFMQSGTSATLYYEDEKKKSLFSAGKDYHILKEFGTLAHIGVVVMHHFKVLDDEAPLFEGKGNQMIEQISGQPTNLAVRLLKAQKHNEYIIFSQWAKEDDYLNWQEKVEHTSSDFNTLIKKPAYFANRPFTTIYYIIQDD